MSAYLFAIRPMIALFLGALVGTERPWARGTHYSLLAFTYLVNWG
jgi:hypothetical protein